MEGDSGTTRKSSTKLVSINLISNYNKTPGIDVISQVRELGATEEVTQARFGTSDLKNSQVTDFDRWSMSFQVITGDDVLVAVQICTEVWLIWKLGPATQKNPGQ